MATFSEGTDHQTQRDEIVEALAKALALPVQYSCRVCVDFHPLPEHNPPHHTHTTPLKQVTPSHLVRDMTDKECQQLESEVYVAASTMNLVLLDSDVSFHSDLELTRLHPHYIQIKVARQKVLQSLIYQLTKTSSERQLQLTHARQLLENAHRSSVIIIDSNVDDACLALELFVESYWAATQCVVLRGRSL